MGGPPGTSPLYGCGRVSNRLGHSTIVTTADIYAHVSPELAKNSAEGLARAIGGQ
jgi:integrase